MNTQMIIDLLQEGDIYGSFFPELREIVYLTTTYETSSYREHIEIYRAGKELGDNCVIVADREGLLIFKGTEEKIYKKVKELLLEDLNIGMMLTDQNEAVRKLGKILSEDDKCASIKG